MPIKINKQEKRNEQGDDLYTAEVTAPDGTWRSPDPLPSVELGRKLLSLGYDPFEIWQALSDAGVQPLSSRDAAIRIRPLLHAVLAGEREVSPWPVSWAWRGDSLEPVLGTQRPYSEAKLAYALFRHDKMLFLNEVLNSAEGIDRDLPYDDEISWAFLRLKRRGWLAIEGDTYGLTPEGRRSVKEIVDRCEPPWPVKELEMWAYVITGRPGRRTGPVKELEKWISRNPPPGDV